TATPTASLYTLSLHDALPISGQREAGGGAGHLDHVVDDLGTRAAVEGEARPSEGGADQRDVGAAGHAGAGAQDEVRERRARGIGDRKSTRLNSSHVANSYAVF